MRMQRNGAHVRSDMYGSRGCTNEDAAPGGRATHPTGSGKGRRGSRSDAQLNAPNCHVWHDVGNAWQSSRLEAPFLMKG